MFKTKIREYLTTLYVILKIFLFYKFKLSLSNCVFSFLDASLGMK